MDLLWISFLNSDLHDWRGSGRSEDRLDKPGWVAEFLAEWHLPVTNQPDAAAIAALKDLRSLLQRIARSLADGAAVAAGDLGALNAALGGGAVLRQVDGAHGAYELKYVPAGTGWAQVHAEIAASLARSLAEGAAERIRFCDNPDCRWVFLDDTRNRNKRFCDDKACGNLMKVRRFRARKKST
ncbi:MAG TPA: CGNR zinc finger domain-containing protein [Symbiobacteriaceae bacterium]|nr:CGNR zinc finger domain-containing protein [Symbiobacteriaceae bacterium]